MIGARSRCERSGATRRWPSSANHTSPTAPSTQIVNARRARERRDASRAAPPKRRMNTAKGRMSLRHRLVAPDGSQRDLAPIIRALWEPTAELVVWGTYEDYCGVSLYTGYPTRMLDSARGDLLFGYRRGDASGLFLTREGFERLWASNGRVFVVGDRGLDIPGAILLAAGPRSMLVTKRPAPLAFRHREEPSRRR